MIGQILAAVFLVNGRAAENTMSGENCEQDIIQSLNGC